MSALDIPTREGLTALVHGFYADVRADASGHMPAAGELKAQADAVKGSAVTRAEVRQQTREDIAHGFRPAAGDA